MLGKSEAVAMALWTVLMYRCHSWFLWQIDAEPGFIGHSLLQAWDGLPPVFPTMTLITDLTFQPPEPVLKTWNHEWVSPKDSKTRTWQSWLNHDGLKHLRSIQRWREICCTAHDCLGEHIFLMYADVEADCIWRGFESFLLCRNVFLCNEIKVFWVCDEI